MTGPRPHSCLESDPVVFQVLDTPLFQGETPCFHIHPHCAEGYTRERPLPATSDPGGFLEEAPLRLVLKDYEEATDRKGQECSGSLSEAIEGLSPC